MIQEQFICHLLETKDFSIIQKNNITSDYFLEYQEEFDFIKNHYEKYKNVPDVETFLSTFDDFDLVNVNESDKYLVETLREEYLFSKSVPIIKEAANLLKRDANEAARYLQSEVQTLVPQYCTPFVDLLHSDSRVKLFEDKVNNPDKWFIPTGFQELDDIIGGWQRGEEFGVIYARTGQGKSWFLAKTLQHSSLIGENAGYISPEMSADKIGYRFDTLNGHFSNKALLRGDVRTVSLDDYIKYNNELASRSNKFIVSTPLDFDKKITVSKLRNYIIDNNLSILGIDGITYLSDERYKRGDNKTTTLTNISEDLMQLTVELGIPILVVVQSNRNGVKDKDNATPELEDIRDSDGIAQNATKVISLRQKNGEALLVDIKKHRDGEFGKQLTYMWSIDTGDFEWVPGEVDDIDEDVKLERQEKIKSKHNNEKKVVF